MARGAASRSFREETCHADAKTDANPADVKADAKVDTKSKAMNADAAVTADEQKTDRHHHKGLSTEKRKAQPDATKPLSARSAANG